MRVTIALVLLLSAGAAGAPVTQDLGGRVSIDWTAMRLVAVGAGAPDLRAPNAAIARVGAERRARVAALAVLDAAARKLPLAAGGTVGDRAAKDEKIDDALRAALRLTRDLAVDYGSDGSVEITLGVPLEAIRQAVSSPASPPALDEAAPTAILVEAKTIAPVLGLALVAGGETVEGPTIWVVSRAAATADPRVGARPLDAKPKAKMVKGVKKGVKQIEVDLEPKALAAARAAGALVVIIGAKAP